MNTLGSIETRRSVKQYDPAHQMGAEEVEKLLGHAMLSPTAFNIQNWRFVTVQDKELRAQIRAAAWDQAQVMQDEGMRSCGMAAQTIMLAAKAMGYDSCPMDGFDFDKVGELINLPEDHAIAMFVAVGKGTKEPWPRPGQIGYDEVAIKDRF